MSDAEQRLALLQRAWHDVANALNTVSMQSEVAKLLSTQGKPVGGALDQVLVSCRAAGELTTAAEIVASQECDAAAVQRLESLLSRR
jgi:hypothetical protein